MKSGISVILLTLVFVSNTIGQVVLSEIMFNPEGTERYNEYVEIVNISITDSVDLTGWSIGDSLKQSEIIGHRQGIVIAPGQYAVILSPNYFSNSTQYDSVIPDSSLLLTIATSQFGAYGFANDRGEPVTLVDSSGVVRSKWRYRTPGEDGFSEEKRLPGRGDIPQNWGKSLFHGGTPGFLNSITPKEIDLSLDSVMVTPQSPSRKDSIVITAKVTNRGSLKVNRARLSVTDVTDSRAIELVNESLHFAGLAWLDSVAVSAVLPPLRPGVRKLKVALSLAEDKNPADNQSVVELFVLPAEGDVVISEVYFYPEGDEPRWLEILNNSDYSADMAGWEIGLDNHRIRLPDIDSLKIGPGERIIVTESVDKGRFFWSTNSFQAELHLPALAFLGVCTLVYNKSVVDSVALSRLTPRPGVSFERNESSGLNQWGLCPHAGGNTFGEPNAFGRTFYDPGFCTDGLFSAEDRIAGQRTRMQICIANMGTESTPPFDIVVKMADNDSLISTTGYGASIPPQQSKSVVMDVVFAKPGLYRLLLLLQSQGDAYANNDTALIDLAIGYQKGAVTINEIMYNTDERDQEWIELFNPGPSVVDLGNWSVADSRKRSLVTDSTLPFAPGEYLVLAHMNATEPASQIFMSLPELNNSGDQIILRDFADNIIDSVAYEPAWGGERMVSLERIRFEEDSTDPLNWASCQDSAGHTAGHKNSVSPGLYDIAIDTTSLSIRPEKPVEGDDVELFFRVVNSGRENLPASRAFITLFSLSEATDPVANDSIALDPLRVSEEKTIRWVWQSVPGGIHILNIAIKSPLDEKPGDNFAEKTFAIGFMEGRIVVNEFMYRPLPDREDWLELYNPGAQPVELAGWSVANADSQSRVSLPYTSRLLLPNQFAVLSSDSVFLWEQDINNRMLFSKFPNFRSDGDDVVLYDAVGHIVDKVSYTPEWGDLRGRSLERISPNAASGEKTNWAQNVSAAGHSAGSVNSVYTRIVPGHTALEISPNPFSPNNDGFDDVAAISITLPTSFARINLRIYDIRGRLIRFLLNNEFSGSTRTVFWDGKNDEGRAARIGLYIVYLEAVDERNSTLLQERKTLVLAAPL